MSTDQAIRAEAAYRTARVTDPAGRSASRRSLVRLVWRPSSIAAMFTAAHRSTTADGAVRHALAAVSIPTTLGRA